ncbi:cadmium resistance transporter [Amorphoplanes digitatis]|uniref:Cadmium resistance protein CadD (Predicted permease) n=1 Tax=Actinoplanes digitatis TaxID=1868 RepID=A0A7W7HUS9_9ACTN|nr:cadmium resistance transporter [Actinoplanes digitatis]MBB4761125.1 cadmium resistance protein CadD (predicted permease) [Actinoplanes digitatis]BFE69480.1 cadmium resistance transporter [Actinoplanes digitatis]GID92741.1 cadmium transporter [Actinoplanes digitatis]
MELSVLGQAAVMFAVTNIDDMLLLAVYFGRTAGHHAAARRIVIGQYAGFLAILAASVLGALGAGLLPDAAIPYLGLLPLLLGIRAAWTVWRERHEPDDDGAREPGDAAGPGVWQVAAVTFANGGDNIGVYVPVFAVAGIAGMTVYATVFLIGVAVWCAAGWFLATRPPVAKTLSRWGHLILPVVLIAIGLVILIEGGAFGL